jgi:NAD(P)-dependent dehydrogenase (short-subunit alcohol dehydrogenase family)
MENLRGRCAVVTHGGGSPGGEIALAFAREGMDVVVASLHEDLAKATAARVEAIGTRALVVQTEAPDPAAMERLAQRAYDAFGEVNVLVLNAGGQYPKPVLDLTRDDWDRMMRIEFGGVLTGLLEFIPRLVAQGGDRHIVNMASLAGVGRADLRRDRAGYVAANSAVVRMTEVMAPALAALGIDMSVVCPGMTEADPSRVLDPEHVAQHVIRAIRGRHLYAFPDVSGKDEVEERHRRIMEAFEQSAAMPSLENRQAR